MKKGMLFLMLIGIITSCSKEDKTNKDLNGEWEMTSYVAFLPSLPAINENDIKWTFDVPNNKLSVINKIESQYPYILASGNYDINVTSKTVTILSVEYDYSIENGTLSISNNPELDGPVMSFAAD